MPTATQVKCACPSCECAVDEDSALQRNGQYFCCEACANEHPDGAECQQSGCGCNP